MERTGGTALLKDREQVADRLLEASAKHSFDPDTELDWDAPLEPGKWFLPERLVSLYGTPIWNRMSEERRIELSRHEAASLASSTTWIRVMPWTSGCTLGSAKVNRWKRSSISSTRRVAVKAPGVVAVVFSTRPRKRVVLPGR